MYGQYDHLDVSELQGKTLKSVSKQDNESLTFETEDGHEYKMWHEQDCCESVYIEDIVGDLNDLVGSPIELAEEATNYEPENRGRGDDGMTWTFYKLVTNKGAVTIRWCGSSNGYYSEGVDFGRRKAKV